VPEESALIQIDATGRLTFAQLQFRCALGRGGVRRDKREGDGATPAGRFALRHLFYRPDRMTPPATLLASTPLDPADGWCDDPGHADYNLRVRLPHPAHCETLWRKDAVYDLILPLGYNDDPPRAGLGSAIFMHVARRDYRPTQGCVALALPDLLSLLAVLPAPAKIEIGYR
jgi:L,D-peptidoglycan transpeptidase YkuD (ErfK/YbiS/YcfS/YnhG family)